MARTPGAPVPGGILKNILESKTSLKIRMERVPPGNSTLGNKF